MQKLSPTEFLAMHAITTLPDSMASRKRLLGMVTGALPRNNPTRLTAQALLLSINQQEKLQAELAFSFSQINQETA